MTTNRTLEPTSGLLPRAVGGVLRQRLDTMPVVVVSGARQTGKSTLVSRLNPGSESLYVSLDDLDIRDQARVAPRELLQRADRMTLDEVQRAPQLLSAIKLAVDRKRSPGRFLLTGSANLLMMRRVSESLAGRASYLYLWPLTRREQLGSGSAGIWTELLEAPCEDWPDVIAASVAPRESWQALALRGGFPTPAHELDTPKKRAVWFDGYVATYLERDLQDLSAIEYLADFRRLMRAACLRLGGLLNQSELARDISLPPTTVQRYLNLLEVSYQAVRVPAFSVNRTKRLTKSPKLYWSDVGLALFLAGETEPRGVHLENIVLHDLQVWGSCLIPSPGIYHWRTTKGAEVDFVVETGDRLMPIEVKSARSVKYSDTAHLRTFSGEYGDLVRGSLLLYDGEETFWIADEILAVPWWKIV